MKHKQSVLPYSAMLIITSFLISSRVSADTTPDAFTFGALDGVPLSTLLYSNPITVTGIDAAAPISISGGEYSIDGGAFTSASGTVNVNDTVVVEQTSAAAYSTATTATLTIDNVSADYKVTTDPMDLSPDQFAFTPQSNVATNAILESNPITISGLAGPTWGLINGGEYSVNGGLFTVNGGYINNGDVIVVRLASSSDPSTITSAVFSAHWIYADFIVETAGATTADPFSFTDQTNVAASTPVVSNSITVSGLSGQAPISVSGGEYSMNGGDYRTDAQLVQNDDVITIKQTSSSQPSTKTTASLTIGSTTADFNATTAAAVDPVDPFSFASQTDVPLSTTVDSNSITVSGLVDPSAPISIAGGMYSINGGVFTSDPGTVVNGDTIVAQQTSASTWVTSTTATVTIGATTHDFVVGTSSIFTFNSQINVPLSTSVISSPITIYGNPDPIIPISIANGEYSVNGGTYTSAAGTVVNGDVITVKQTTSSNYLTTNTTTLTLGQLVGTFDTATLAAPDPVDPFSFTAQIDVPLSTTVDSNSITVSGLTNPSAPISVVGGTYSVNGGAFTSTAGTVVNGDVVVVEQTSAATFFTTTTATLAIDSGSADFNVTTLAADITPDAFSFTPQTGIALSTLVDSNPITVSGIDAPSPISVSGGTYSINGGTFTSAAGTVSNGDTVVVEQTSSASPLTTTTATLAIDSVNADFNVTTLAADITPDAFSFTPQTGIALSTLVDSNPITVSGIDAPSPISVSGGTYSINGGTFTSAAGTVSNGDTVVVEQTSSASPLTTTTATLAIDSVNADFNVTTTNADITPDQFTFTPQTDVPVNAQLMSNTVSITGIDALSPISVFNGTYSINGGAFTAVPGLVANGDTITVRQTSSSTFSTTTTATLTIDGIVSDFNITTLAGNNTPNAFNFVVQSGVALSTPVTSNTVTVSGINVPSPISISGNGGTYSINGGAFTSAAGTVSNGDTVVVKQTSSSSLATTTTTTLTIDGVNADFNVTTISSSEVAVFEPVQGTINAVLGQPFTFTFHATKPSGATVTYSLGTNAPAGATIDPNTGVFTWTPTGAGTFTFDVIASDPTILTVTINVTTTPQPAVVTTSGNHHCGSEVCQQYRDYRRHYKNSTAKADYFVVKPLQDSNPTEFARLRSIYLQYKNLSRAEITQLSAKIQADFFLYKNYNGYKHYKNLKDRV